MSADWMLCHGWTLRYQVNFKDFTCVVGDTGLDRTKYLRYTLYVFHGTIRFISQAVESRL